MAGTCWMNSFTGKPFEAAELRDLRTKAHAVYMTNGHIFEDEADALTALGAVPGWKLLAS
jgi:hypothetical protein